MALPLAGVSAARACMGTLTGTPASAAGWLGEAALGDGACAASPRAAGPQALASSRAAARAPQ
jgi:hypothetical protein